jgi:hypothetical protein
MKLVPGFARAVIGGLAIAALAGCSISIGGGSSSSPQPASNVGAGATASTGGGANAASTTYCSRVPTSLIEKTLKVTVGKLDPTVEGPVAVCSYSGKYEVLVRYQVNETPTLFSQNEQSMAGMHEIVVNVTHLGDSAFSAFTTGNGGIPASYTLAALEGTTAIFITSPATPNTERSLMKILLAEL